MNMIVYIGTKTVKAFPMSRLAYNEYRGWVMPANEDPAEEGYLVEYLDGGKPCDDRHDGYISWSPKAVFEQSYKPQGTWLDRLKAEHEHESTKLAALDKMLSGLKPDNVSDKQWIFMNRQQFHMRMLVQILADLIDEAEGKDVPLMRTPAKHLVSASGAEGFIDQYQIKSEVTTANTNHLLEQRVSQMSDPELQQYLASQPESPIMAATIGSLEAHKITVSDPIMGGSEDTAISDLGRPLHRTHAGYAKFDNHMPIKGKV